MKKLAAVLAVFSLVKAHGQDPVFLNASQSLTYLNSSFAGSNGGIRSQISYRNQWPNLSGNYKTYRIGVDGYVKSLKGGIALSIISDNAANGTLVTTGLNISYARYIYLKEKDLFIVPSLQVGYGQKSLDRDNLNYGDLIDSRLGIVWSGMMLPNNNTSYLDVSSGFLLNYKNRLYTGLSVSHMNQPDVALLGSYRLPVRVTAHASYYVAPNTQFFYRLDYQNTFAVHQLYVNTILKKVLIVGGGYAYPYGPHLNIGLRSQNFMVQFEYDKGIRFPYHIYSAGSYELHFSFGLRNKEKRDQFTNFESM